ncbi:S-layer homology domain-containing protein [Paenibacillus sp. PL2-23]|uniref:S-layer homology domain-containing protein n=1 Tax=Paenibacillus sp. PL2-23 TaxID=2100729 RepID=UPI0030F727AE
MKKRKPIAMLMSFIMMLSVLPIVPITAHADANGCDASARAAYGGLGGTELFLGGKYIELGISNWGDFGTEGTKPANFHGTHTYPYNQHRSNIGMSADHDGFCQGIDMPIDYYLPGTAKEGFSVGYATHPDGIRSNDFRSNMALMDGRQPVTNGPILKGKEMSTTVINTSQVDKGILSATIVSTWINRSLTKDNPVMEVRQVISFHEDDKFYRNDVTLTNISDQSDYPRSWTSTRYSRSLDPDNTVDQNDMRFYETRNVVTHTIAEDGIAVVKAESHLDDDRLYQVFGSRMPIFYYSEDPAARGSVFGGYTTNPYTDAVYTTPRQKNLPWVNDVSIGMSWDAGPLEPGERSEVFTYYTSLDERVFEEVIADIQLDERGLQPFEETEANDGTVSGKQKVAISGATLVETLDMNHIRVNNLPAGLGFAATRLSDSEIEMELTGAAAQHRKEASVDNLSVTVGKNNLIGSSADLTTKTFSVTFMDPALLALDKGIVTGNVNGELDEALTLSITNGTFATDISIDDIVVHHLPDGLSATLTGASAHELQIGFSGATADMVDVNTAYVTVQAGGLIGSPTDLRTNTFKIDFPEIEPFVVVQSPLYESEANDGSIADQLVLTLVDGTWDSNATDAVNAVNWPAGLEPGEAILNSPTQMTVSINGQASSHEWIDSIQEAQVEIMGIPSNTFSIMFRSPLSFITASPDVLHNAGDGSIAETLTVTLHNGRFAGEVMSSGVTVNNLPEGLGFDVARISDTQLELQFTGQATKKLEASSFASVTVDAGNVMDAVSSLTSNPVDIRVPDDASLAVLDAMHLTWDTIREENVLQTSVQTNVWLPATGIYGSNITWTTSKDSVISLDGTVVRPSFEEGDQEVTLTAELVNGTSTQTKIFELIVKKLAGTDEQSVNEDADQVTWDMIRQKNVIQDSVTYDLNLPSEGEYGSSLTWTTSQAAVIDTNGKVVRPQKEEGDQQVTLVVRISKGDAAVTTTFDLIVIALEDDVQAQLDEVIGTLRIGYADQDSAQSVTQDITLISEGFYDAEVVWTSHRSELISHTGKVNRPLKDTVVRITARVTKDGFFREKDFFVTVKGTSGISLPQDEDDVEIGYAPGDSADHVTKNLYLTKLGHTGSEVTWASDKPAVISNSGRVNRPGPDEADEIVELTATLRDPDNPLITRTKTFRVTVIKLSDQEAVDEAAKKLKIDDAAEFVDGDIWEGVTEAFLLLKQGAYDTDITWESNTPSVIEVDLEGEQAQVNVTRQREEKHVILTATFTRNDKTATKRYLIIVKALGITKDGGTRLDTVRDAKLATLQDGAPVEQSIKILRTVMSNGTKIDTIIVDDNGMYDLVASIDPNDPDALNRLVTITHDDDELEHADEIAVEIPATAITTMAGRNISLHIGSDLASIQLDEASVKAIEDMGTDLYFRVAPVNQTQDQARIQSNAMNIGATKITLADNEQIQTIGKPRVIESNYHGVITEVLIPLSDFSDQIPVGSSAERDVFLNSLRIYVEHSDGEFAVYTPQRMVYTNAGVPTAAAFQISKFSSFQLIRLVEGSTGGGSTGPGTLPALEPVSEEEFPLTCKRVQELQDLNEVIEVNTESWTIKLNAADLNLEDISLLFDGQERDHCEIVMKVTIVEADEDQEDEFKKAAEHREVDVVGDQVYISIEAVYDGQTRPVTSRGKMEFTLPIPDGMKITTGVLYREGNLHHQPTYVFIENGRYYARINSFETGLFGLIWNPQQFADVENHWSKLDVNDMYSRLVVNGVNEASYEPEREITRAEFTAILVRALGIVRHELVVPKFSDVPDKAWYQGEMAVAIENGLIEGYPDGTFRPGNNITRQEAMMIMKRAMTITELESSLSEELYLKLLLTFVDGNTIADWAESAVQSNLSTGIIVGRNGRLDLNAGITRAETSAIVRRLLILSELINP